MNAVNTAGGSAMTVFFKVEDKPVEVQQSPAKE